MPQEEKGPAGSLTALCRGLAASGTPWHPPIPVAKAVLNLSQSQSRVCKGKGFIEAEMSWAHALWCWEAAVQRFNEQ